MSIQGISKTTKSATARRSSAYYRHIAGHQYALADVNFLVVALKGKTYYVEIEKYILFHEVEIENDSDDKNIVVNARHHKQVNEIVTATFHQEGQLNVLPLCDSIADIRLGSDSSDANNAQVTSVFRSKNLSSFFLVYGYLSSKS